LDNPNPALNSNMGLRLEGSVALVTGAAGKRGMGRAIALRLARDGADVVINDMSQSGVRYTDDDRIEDWQGLKSVEAEIRAMGRKALAVEADISSPEQVEEMVSKSIDEFGKIDILICNAGTAGRGSMSALKVSLDDWNRVLAVNLTGTYLCNAAVGKRMVDRGQGGKIINMSSLGGKIGNPAFAAYCASKFGVIGITQVMALELAPHRIYVNAVCPGWITTEMSEAGRSMRGHMRKGMSLEEASAKAFANQPTTPLGRLGHPEEVANLITFLASPEADFITGQAININGGYLMAH